MCGILGSINFPFDNYALDTMKHRGPDDFGIDKFEVNEHSIQLAHRRLSIIDLTSAGHQPMSTRHNQYAIIFNGEIYNHFDLRNKLHKDIQFKGHSDTETILYYLKTFGINSVLDFNGIFAFAFLDKNKNILYLCRDPFGVKPLYYFLGENNQVIFASEIRPLKYLMSKQAIDKDGIASLLRLRYNASPDTIFKEIKKIRPGHYLEINLNNRNLESKNWPYINETPASKSFSAGSITNLYGNALENAVKSQLLSDVEIGILLSGGVDSALVAYLAKKNYTGNLKAFTIGFDADYAEDEIQAAAETAKALEIEHHFKKITFSDFLNVVKTCSLIVEEPLATTSMIPMYFLAELAANHVKVVLTGQGADETLGGYVRYKSELLRKIIPGTLANSIKPILRLSNVKNERILRGINSIGIKNDILRFLAVYEVFSQSEIQNLLNLKDKLSSNTIEYFYTLLNCKSKKEPVERMMALDARLNLSDDLLNYTDKITMHFSLECRVPMLDLKLVNFIESLPRHYKLNLRAGSKIIHRQFARQSLPDEIVNRKKRGFESPTKYWFKKDAHIIEEILLNEGTTFSRYFNLSYVAKIIKQHKQGYNKEKQIFLLLSIYYIVNSENY